MVTEQVVDVLFAIASTVHDQFYLRVAEELQV